MASSLRTGVLTAWCRAGVVLEDWGSIASELKVPESTGRGCRRNRRCGIGFCVGCYYEMAYRRISAGPQ